MSSKKTELVRAVGEAVQLFQEASDLFDDAAAAALGLNRTDLKCLSVIARRAPVAAGAIGKAAGLTRGAMTTALDRMEGAGYARRRRDPDDRRGVLVELTAKGRGAIDAIWGEYIRKADAFFAAYTIADLSAILRYLVEGRAVQEANMARVRKLRLA